MPPTFTTRPELIGTFGMVTSTHWLASGVGMASFADRETYYGDPDFSAVPTDVLLSAEYASDRVALVSGTASDYAPGVIEGV